MCDGLLLTGGLRVDCHIFTHVCCWLLALWAGAGWPHSLCAVCCPQQPAGGWSALSLQNNFTVALTPWDCFIKHKPGHQDSMPWVASRTCSERRLPRLLRKPCWYPGLHKINIFRIVGNCGLPGTVKICGLNRTSYIFTFGDKDLGGLRKRHVD